MNKIITIFVIILSCIIYIGICYGFSFAICDIADRGNFVDSMKNSAAICAIPFTFVFFFGIPLVLLIAGLFFLPICYLANN